MLSGFLFKVCTAFEEGKTEPQLISSLWFQRDNTHT